MTLARAMYSEDASEPLAYSLAIAISLSTFVFMLVSPGNKAAFRLLLLVGILNLVKRTIKMENLFGLAKNSKPLLCTLCGRGLIDMMCACGECFIGYRGNCKHEHILEDPMPEVSRFLQEISDLKTFNTSEEDMLYLKRFSLIQHLKQNEALSHLNSTEQFVSPYYNFTTSIIKDSSTDFYLKSMKFFYVFNTSYTCKDFLNSYLSTKISNRILQVVYKFNDVFLYKSGATAQVGFQSYQSFIHETEITDYFSIVVNGTQVLFDLLTGNAYILCDYQSGVVLEIQRTIQEECDIVLENPVIKFFEGSFNIKTTALLFKVIFANYMNHPVINTRWSSKSPDKSVNDYIFYLKDANSLNTTHEYVKMSITSICKVNMLKNLWNISFVGNDKSLLIPFISSLISLIIKIENIKYDLVFTPFYNMENDFIRQIQSGRFEFSDRHVKSFSSFGVCKKQVFIMAFLSFIGSNVPSQVMTSINYRPIASSALLRKRLSKKTILDNNAILMYAIFFDSVDINPIFSEKTPFIRTKGELYTINPTSLNFSLSDNTKKKGVRAQINDTGYSIVFNDLTLLTSWMNCTILEYPIEGVIKGIEFIDSYEGRYPKRKVSKDYVDKCISIDSNINNIILCYLDNLIPNKLAMFSTDLICHSDSLVSHCLSVLKTEENILVLLSQHLWDHSSSERMKLLDTINVELQQDLLEHVFNCRILYFIFDHKESEYVFQVPRSNGWYAINQAYDKVMFVFKSKNDRLYTPIFDLSGNEAYCIPLTTKIRNAYSEVSIIEPNTTSEETIPSNPEGQLINSYGKSVGFKGTRHSPRAPIMEPKQTFGEMVVLKKTRLIPVPGTTTMGVYHSINSTENDVSLDYIDVNRRGEEIRQTKQNLSVLFKVILKYVFLNLRLPSVRLVEYLEAIIVERRDDLQLFTNDLIYNMIKIDMSREVLSTIYPSVFRNGRFEVQNAPKLRQFILTELKCVQDCPEEFFKEFLEADLDYTLIKRDPNEKPIDFLVRVNLVKTNLASNTNIQFFHHLTPEILFNQRIVLMKYEDAYYFIVETMIGGSETACFVCEQWKNTRRVSEYHESRILEIPHDSFQLVQGKLGRVRQWINPNDIPSSKVLQYTHKRKDRFASLLRL
jgi:hypothetical protein